MIEIRPVCEKAGCQQQAETRGRVMTVKYLMTYERDKEVCEKPRSQMVS